MQVRGLLPQRPPQPFDENFVEIPTSTIHGYFDICLGQGGDLGCPSELRSLVPCPAGYCGAMSREGVFMVSGLPYLAIASFNGWTLCLAAISCAVLSPRSASSATVALNLSEKLRLFVICVSCLQGWIHLSTLSNFAGPLQFHGVQPNPAAV